MRDENKALADMMHEDAKSIRDHEAFDSKLHQDTVRRIRHLDDSSSAGGWRRLKLTVSLVTTAAACAFVFLLLRSSPVTPPDPELSRLPNPPATSALAYRQALAEGEGAMLAMLDQDARILLPQSAPVFQSLR